MGAGRGDTDLIDVLVKSVINEAFNINAWEFRRVDDGELPPFTAGAHIDLRLANGLVRSYSLCNSQTDRHRYVVAINKDASSRGGSKFIHDTLKAGDRIKISSPRNNFALIEDAKHTVFIAGGIGITPIWSMIQRLEDLGRSWEIHYSTRLRHMCAFKEHLELLEKQKPRRVNFTFDQEPGGKMIDLLALMTKVPADAHLYCCGPGTMLKAFEVAAKDAGRPQDHVHLEYFAAKEAAAVDGGFTVVLQRSNKSFVVRRGKTILETLLENSIDVAFSCTEGVCGTCATSVIEGVPDHRDAILTASERASNKTMLICCSGSKTSRLVLDL
jgi:vanillate O-demethylase ferredoxin subunit